jgi:hypothetical protein
MFLQKDDSAAILFLAPYTALRHEPRPEKRANYAKALVPSRTLDPLIVA